MLCKSYAQIIRTSFAHEFFCASYAREFCRASHTHKLFTQVAHEFFAHEFVTQAMRVSFAHEFVTRVFCASYTRQLCRASHTHKLFTQVTHVSFAHEFCHAFNCVMCTVQINLFLRRFAHAPCNHSQHPYAPRYPSMHRE